MTIHIHISDLFPAVRKTLPAAMDDCILSLDSLGFWVTFADGQSYCLKEADALYMASPKESVMTIRKRLESWHQEMLDDVDDTHAFAVGDH